MIAILTVLTWASGWLTRGCVHILADGFAAEAKRYRDMHRAAYSRCNFLAALEGSGDVEIGHTVLGLALGDASAQDEYDVLREWMKNKEAAAAECESKAAELRRRPMVCGAAYAWRAMKRWMIR